MCTEWAQLPARALASLLLLDATHIQGIKRDIRPRKDELNHEVQARAVGQQLKI